ncbi:MAG: hypothetical protein ACRD3O_19230, partial [Terriglobia bacterium]
MPTNHAVEFLVWLLIAASIIAVIAARLKIPYTVALVIGGLILGALHHLPLVQTLVSFGLLARHGGHDQRQIRERKGVEAARAAEFRSAPAVHCFCSEKFGRNPSSGSLLSP